MNAREQELKSSAVTLSDMEVFIFPELMYSLVLANIMSPRIWRWRDAPWFKGLERMKPHRRIARVKQYIMDHYAFNLDLATWGLTTKERELARFRDFIDPAALAQSNALFGYEGDKYYFDIDIRTHFGLDKYEGNVIPYWKTETVEAMDAFRHRPNYASGAGECVSLATLYAAALFIVARVPLKDIFLMATPLHSQNFVDVADGILTNNRRLVTKTMWNNGTALSAQARRALEHERVTLVAHESGCIHVLYPEATIDPEAFQRFATKLRGFLQTTLTAEILGNFVRHSGPLQKCFQVRWRNFGVDRYIASEKLLAYEGGVPYRFNDDTREKLMEEVAGEDFECQPLPGRIVLDDIEQFVRDNAVDIRTTEGFARLKEQFASTCMNAECAIKGLREFCYVEPRLPNIDAKRLRREQTPLELHPTMSRDEIIARLESLRDQNDSASLAFYAYRDLNRVEAEPFLEAALDRCPACVSAAAALDDAAVEARVSQLVDESIYDDPGRIAHPDEVWNFGRGDGAEKALLLATILRTRHPEAALRIDVTPTEAALHMDGRVVRFPSRKALRQQTWDCTAFAPIAVA
ncbi:MAG: hypothetical protein O3B24_01955 [Verrucomicrobia bacterium]|nr:hypothetical protein [Verrucomicrobiota bacterium]